VRRPSARPATWWALLVVGVTVVAASPSLVPAKRVHAQGRLAALASTAPSVDGTVDAEYDTTGRSTLTLHLSGLEPGETYAAYAYRQPCDATKDLRFQQFPDRKQPSSNPLFANPFNEIWFVGKADQHGQATSRVRRSSQFAPTWSPRSVVLEGDPIIRGTSKLPGPRLACLTVAF
jgi:hypothetical protein